MQCQAVVFAVLALCLHQGYALKCFSCNSTDTKCGDSIDSSLAATNCPPNAVMKFMGLMKTLNDMSSHFGMPGGNFTPAPKAEEQPVAFACMKAVKEDNGKKVIMRSCLPKDTCTLLKETMGGVLTFCDTCESDSCNTAAGVIPSALLMMCAAVLILFKQ